MNTFARWDGSGIMTRFCDEITPLRRGNFGGKLGAFKGVGTQKGASTCQCLFVFVSGLSCCIYLIKYYILGFKGDCYNSST